MMTIAYISIAIAELIVTDIIATNLFECPRKQFPVPCFFYAAYLFVSVAQISFHYILNFNLLVSTLFTMSVCISYRAKWRQRALIALLSVGIGLASEGLLWMLVRIVTDISGMDISPEASGFVITVFASALLEIGFTILLLKIIRYFRVHTPSIYASIIAIFSVCLISMLLLLVSFANTSYLVAAIPTIILILIALALCCGIFCDQIRVQQERLRLNFLEKQNQDQVAHYTALYDRNNETHRLRHDLHNFLISAEALIELGDIEKLKAHIEKQREAVRPQKLTDTGNPLLDAVLSAKQHDSPEIDFQILLPQLHCDQIDPMDTAMLLAAALDNAVEGCADSSEPYIHIRVEQKGSMILVEIQNPTHNHPKERLGRLVSTKPEPEKHGYGVLSMRRIAERYSGNLTWSAEHGVFILRVLMQDIPPVVLPQI
ncbi:GHKL domain-containing protein [Butyricicoccus sp. 1XD8-22]|nr:GHKL domain-containing protein [Butyricicoccus sp. 1XD8-22]